MHACTYACIYCTQVALLLSERFEQLLNACKACQNPASAAGGAAVAVATAAGTDPRAEGDWVKHLTADVWELARYLLELALGGHPCLLFQQICSRNTHTSLCSLINSPS